MRKHGRSPSGVGWSCPNQTRSVIAESQPIAVSSLHILARNADLCRWDRDRGRCAVVQPLSSERHAPNRNCVEPEQRDIAHGKRCGDGDDASHWRQRHPRRRTECTYDQDESHEFVCRHPVIQPIDLESRRALCGQSQKTRNDQGSSETSGLLPGGAKHECEDLCPEPTQDKARCHYCQEANIKAEK